MKVKKAVIPVAGLGTRLLPATKAVSKEILPVIDTPVIQFIVEEAIDAGIEDILIITGKGKQEIEDHFDANPSLEQNLISKGKTELLEKVVDSSKYNIHYVRQHYPHGLGDAVLQAKTFVGDDPFLVMLGDDITRYEDSEPLSKTLINLYQETGQAIIGGVRVSEDDSKRYGMMELGKNEKDALFNMKGIVEKPQEDAPSDLAACGRYILEPSIFDILENLTPDKTGEIELTDALDILADQSDVLAYDYKGEWFEVGESLGLLKASIIFALDHPEVEEEFRPYLVNLAKELKANK